jgi:L-ascorbate metabolism protein UlaG (beta-lactamase superfamily)
MAAILTRRRFAAGAALTAASAAGYLYSRSPQFWQTYFSELGSPVNEARLHPNPAQWPDTGFHAAWIGHATILMKVDGYTILTDPVFSERCGVSLGLFTIGVKRLVQPALTLNDLPKIDLVLSSHAHFDHLDIPSLKKLESRSTQMIMARQTSDLVRVPRWSQVREIGWGEKLRAGPVSVTSLRVKHWGARIQRDTWRGYTGYLLEAGRWRILFPGDTAMSDDLRVVKSSRPIDVAFMPIGAYNPWIANHCTPEQAHQMSQMAGVEQVMPIHHRTFVLSREPVLEPIERWMTHARHALGQEPGAEVHLT